MVSHPLDFYAAMMKQDVYCSGGISRPTESIKASGLCSYCQTEHLLHNFDISTLTKDIEVVTQILDQPKYQVDHSKPMKKYKTPQ